MPFNVKSASSLLVWAHDKSQKMSLTDVIFFYYYYFFIALYFQMRLLAWHHLLLLAKPMARLTISVHVYVSILLAMR